MSKQFKIYVNYAKDTTEILPFQHMSYFRSFNINVFLSLVEQKNI